MKNITPKTGKAKIRGTPLKVPPFIVERCNRISKEYLKELADPPSIHDLVMDHVKERGLENKCNAYVLSKLYKSCVFWRDAEQADKRDKYVLSKYQQYEQYAVQLYVLGD